MNIHGVRKSWTRLSDFTFTFHFHASEKEMAAHSSVLAWRIPGMGDPGQNTGVGSLSVLQGIFPTQGLNPVLSHCTWILYHLSHQGSPSRKHIVESCCVQPHRWQPTRLPCPWDSPGKNTGVGCHFLLRCVKVKSESEVSQSCLMKSLSRVRPSVTP